MYNLSKNNSTKLAALAGMVFLGTGVAEATTIPATISTTLTITTDSHLTTDVSCAVPTTPGLISTSACIKFGASGIELDLNGHTITGNGGQTSCTLNFAETGIETNGQNNVSIFGPGLVRKFNGISIVVSGNNSMVEGIAITSSCVEGVRVLGSHNEVEGNSISRANVGGPFFAGIFLSAPGGQNSILNNEVVGASQGGEGIFVGELGAPSNNNLIQENDASGNPQPGIFIAQGSTGNTVRHNQALGNGAFDILDANALPSNNYGNNLCEVSNLSNICKLPNIAGHRNGPVDRN